MRVPIFARLLLPAVLLAGFAIPAQADLDSYLKRPEPAYRWEKQGMQKVEGGKIYDLHLVSQVWQGITWEHHLQIFWPDKIAHPHFCALYNTGGSGSRSNEAMGMALAQKSDSVFAILYNIPNQPLFGGKTEDALVVYTWSQFFKTGDESWPLHFPMAKAVIKAMDTIQAFARESHLPSIDGFLINGASKRGWTTWLDGASRDPRIKAIAPMVIDTLNVQAQIPHQLKAYGKPSEQVGDYTSGGMLTLLFTPRGKRLMELEDPYSYRDRLTMPKLLILGTNDRYWSQDSLNLYWGDLKGPKWVLYTPNSGHGLEDRERVFNTLAAFIRMVAGHQTWPRMQWSYAPTPGGAVLSFKSNPKPVSARLFHNHAPTQDFRDARWSFDPVPVKGLGFTASHQTPAEGYDALFGEATYNLDGQPFTLSTQIRILGMNQP